MCKFICTRCEQIQFTSKKCTCNTKWRLQVIHKQRYNQIYNCTFSVKRLPRGRFTEKVPHGTL